MTTAVKEEVAQHSSPRRGPMRPRRLVSARANRSKRLASLVFRSVDIALLGVVTVGMAARLSGPVLALGVGRVIPSVVRRVRLRPRAAVAGDVPLRDARTAHRPPAARVARSRDGDGDGAGRRLAGGRRRSDARRLSGLGAGRDGDDARRPHRVVVAGAALARRRLAGAQRGDRRRHHSRRRTDRRGVAAAAREHRRRVRRPSRAGAGGGARGAGARRRRRAAGPPDHAVRRPHRGRRSIRSPCAGCARSRRGSATLPNEVALVVQPDESTARSAAIDRLEDGPLAPLSSVGELERRAYAKRFQDLAARRADAGGAQPADRCRRARSSGWTAAARCSSASAAMASTTSRSSCGSSARCGPRPPTPAPSAR